MRALLISLTLTLTACGPDNQSGSVELKSYYFIQVSSSLYAELNNLDQVALGVPTQYTIRQNDMWNCPVILTLNQLGQGLYSFKTEIDSLNTQQWFSCGQTNGEFELTVGPSELALLNKVN